MNSNENSHLIDDINKKHEDASFIREQKKRAKEIEKLKKDRLKLEKDILKKIEKASYEKEKEIEKQQKKNKKKSFFARLKEYFKKRKEENKLKELELKKVEEKKKQEYELRKAKKLELEKGKKAKKEEQRRILEEKKAEKKRLREEEKQRKREEKQILSSSDNIDLSKPINKSKEDKKLRKQKRLEEKEKRKLNKISQAMEKNKKIKKEREQARKERKEKALLIKKAQEESRAKAKKERKSLEEKITEWYNNLSFVKDRKNRRELQRQTLLIDFEGSDAERSDEKIMYKYVAKNGETGKVETGMFAAFSKLDVHSFLLAEGYEVYEITPQKNISKTFTLFTAKFTASELDFFLTQLSTFLKSGITLVESIKILSKQCKKKGQQNVYKSLIYELTMGENFSEALQKQGNIFPRLLINMIKTSELTGDLPKTLDDMADYYREIEKTRKQMMSALTYPLVVLVFAIAVLVYIMVLVVPQFVDIYGSLGTTLPPITVAILNVSNFLKKNLLMLGIGLLVFIIIFIVLFKTIKVFKTVVQTILMNIPIIGKIIIYNEITMFTKTFASLLNHNVYITDCMEVLSKITNNEVYKMLIFDTITNLARGEAISNSFKNHWAFPVIAYEMILTGEKTGQLGPMMDKVANYYQEQHKNAVNQIKAFIEPVMIIILAVIVGVVLLSVVLPMFDMYQQISQT